MYALLLVVCEKEGTIAKENKEGHIKETRSEKA
jgi:hypothetical protein